MYEAIMVLTDSNKIQTKPMSALCRDRKAVTEGKVCFSA